MSPWNRPRTGVTMGVIVHSGGLSVHCTDSDVFPITDIWIRRVLAIEPVDEEEMD